MIRKAKFKDLVEILNLENLTFDSGLTRKDLENNLINEQLFYFVYEIEKEIIGYISGQVVNDEAEIYFFTIKDNYRKKGYGDQLLKYLLNLCKEYEIKTITLETRVSNLAARKIYLKNSFIEIGIREKYYTYFDEDAVILRWESDKNDNISGWI